MNSSSSRSSDGTGNKRPLPWQPGKRPLLLALMQGVTNRAMRSLFIDWVRPDAVFTEFVRVNAAAPVRRIAAGDLKEMAPEEKNVPLVVQLIGHGTEALVAAAEAAQAAGTVHINLNMGCPYGRMTSGPTGGGLLRHPEMLAELIPELRRTITGTFSVKVRAGYDDPGEIFRLLPLFESAAVDFIVLHPRTVQQHYTGAADHAITAQVVRETAVPIIANGDIRTAAAGLQILDETGAAGLMLGRGAIADPFLFRRLRQHDIREPDQDERKAMLQGYLRELLVRYGKVFCGEAQVLAKIKEVFHFVDEAHLEKPIKRLRKARNIGAFMAALEELQ
ncbi:tRNA-dihydrouridine synthase family protein [Geotalea sp. SG265]|uniref:tRNA dihydrouridine synthase n=1 Tax=Geotalea sp. SG265 TaxID=2922867 RepID=UPI001FAF6516|nr:tRNA-dihydrouridine synthase family protein [Geotalea sp. SG265]